MLTNKLTDNIVTLSDFTVNGVISGVVALGGVSVINVNQTTTGILMTLDTPSIKDGRQDVVFVVNTGTAILTVQGESISPGCIGAYIYNGTTWAVLSLGGSGGSPSITESVDVPVNPPIITKTNVRDVLLELIGDQHPAASVSFTTGSGNTFNATTQTLNIDLSASEILVDPAVSGETNVQAALEALEAAGGGGGLTSVGLSAPAEFTVTGSPLTADGTITLAKANQAVNTVYAGPSSGGAAAPTFRVLAGTDIPLATTTEQGAMPALSGTAGQYVDGATGLWTNLPASSTGGLTSVGLSVPAEFTVSNSPLTADGTITIGKANQAANQFFAGPASGAAAVPTFRALAGDDLPDATTTAKGAMPALSGTASQYIDGATGLWTNLPSGGGGGLTSVGLSMPAEFTVTGSPLTANGSLAVTKANQGTNLVYAGPSSGAAAAPTFRALAGADLPVVTTTARGAIPALSGTAGQYLDGGTGLWTTLPSGGGGGGALTETVYTMADADIGADLYTTGIPYTMVANTTFTDIPNIAMPLDANTFYLWELMFPYSTTDPTLGLQTKIITDLTEVQSSARYDTFGTANAVRAGLFDNFGVHTTLLDSSVSTDFYILRGAIWTMTAQTVKIQAACETAAGNITIWNPCVLVVRKVKVVVP